MRKKRSWILSLVSVLSVLLFSFGSIKFAYADGKDLTSDEGLKNSMHKFLLDFFDLSISKKPVDCSNFINDEKLKNYMMKILIEQLNIIRSKKILN